MTVRSNISKKTEKILEHREHFINKIKSIVGTSSKEENAENVRFFVYPLLFYNCILECTKLHKTKSFECTLHENMPNIYKNAMLK